MIYRSKNIFKEPSNSEKGDIDFIPVKERREFIADIRFRLEDVLFWEKYIGDDFQNRQEKIFLVLKYGDNSLFLLEKLEDFDIVMQKNELSNIFSKNN